MAEVRWYKAEDLEALRRIHASMGFAYELPDPRGRNVVARFVGVDGGEPVAAVMGRRTAEAYFLLKPGWGTPAERYRIFLELHNRACDTGRLLGLEDVNVFLPPRIERRFGKRLLDLGWQSYEDGAEWRCYTKEI